MRLRKLTCPNCTGSLEMEIPRNTTTVFCPYCGQSFLLDDEKKEYTFNKNINIGKTIHERYTDDADVIRAKSEATRDNRDFILSFIGIAIPILILLCIIGGFALNEAFAKKSGKINAGNCSQLIGKNYQTVEAHFEAAGFTSIELIDLDDAGIAFWEDGKVDTISVGGNSSFESTDWFYPDTKVVIAYH